MPFTHILHLRREKYGDAYKPQSRVYLHHTASDVTVKWNEEDEDFVYARDGAYRFFEQAIYMKKLFDTSKFAYIIAAVWADTSKRKAHIDRTTHKMIDFFGFYDFDDKAKDDQWRAQNPSVFAAVIRHTEGRGIEPVPIGWKWDEEKKLFVPQEGTHCEDMNIILGKEAEHRRNTYSLDEYLDKDPDLGRKILLPNQ
ncbi:hypothetical protein KY325_03000 [Candidatus Woesearchaeota archaeon]|nr:hypothetical protein [Candidatus Woesearchaeota archaeon]MBW3018099.1 hypothetical protein [Candidatus Woesearchaeota archaeon]